LAESYLGSGLDALMFAVPCVALLALGMFRLDSILAASPSAGRAGQRFCKSDEDGEPIVRDPDGRESFECDRGRG
jgi:hypothetical protein